MLDSPVFYIFLITKASQLHIELPKNFDPEYYQARYPDVDAAVADGRFKSAAEHWLKFGFSEGRLVTPPEISTLVGGNVFSPLTYRYPYRDQKNFIEFSATTGSAGPEDQEIIPRIISAYRLMIKKQPANELVDTSGMWHLHAQRSPQLIKAIDNSEYTIVAELLATMFQSHLTHGIAMGKATYAMSKLAPEHFAAQFGDRLLRLAEAVSVAPIRSPEQGDYASSLDLNVKAVVDGIEKAIGLPLVFPQVGGLFGGILHGQPFPELSLTHLYAAHRIRQMFETNIGGLPNVAIEIGGGFGGLAYYCAKLFPSRYTIFDLPLSALIQSYFLLKAPSNVPVVLYGEENSALPSITISPWWEITTVGKMTVDLAINQDSIPEMPVNIGQFYVSEIGRQVRGIFYSINQEQRAMNSCSGHQLLVPELVSADERYNLRSRNLFWLRDGYVEEAYSVN